MLEGGVDKGKTKSRSRASWIDGIHQKDQKASRKKETGTSLIRATIYIRSVPLVHYKSTMPIWRLVFFFFSSFSFFFSFFSFFFFAQRAHPASPSVVSRFTPTAHLHTVGQFPTRLNSDRPFFLFLTSLRVSVSFRFPFARNPFHRAGTKKARKSVKKTPSFFQDAGVSWNWETRPSWICHSNSIMNVRVCIMFFAYRISAAQ